ncbi:hypothetical protein SLE2022_015640 [Rubroshorea leprosula]
MNSSGGIHSPGRKTRRRGIRAPVTPPLRWKFQPMGSKHKSKKRQECPGSGAGVQFWRGGHVGVSARKLAAGLWQLPLSGDVLKCCKYGSGSECGFSKGLGFELESHFPYRKSAIEGSTKWDSRCLKTSNAYHLQNRTKVLENQVKAVSVISSLQAELVQAQSHIKELEAELLSKKKIRYLLRKLGEERSSQWSREFDKSAADINELKDELRRERKAQQKLEIRYSKIRKELAKAELSAKQFKHDYEKEKKVREILEEVCNELSKKLGEEKVQFEALEGEMLTMQKELEEERNMLQMAEVWREGRVQMKLADAKVALENKYATMNKLMSVLESFLRSRSSRLNMTELREAEQIIQAAKSVNIQDTKEFDYVSARAENIVSIIEEIRQADSYQRENEPGFRLSPPDNACNYHARSPSLNDFNDINEVKHSTGQICHNNGYVENQASSYCLEGSDPSPKQGISALSGLECNANDGQNSLNMERAEVCSVSAEQSKQKVYPALLGRSVPISGQGKGSLSNATSTTLGTTSPRRKSVEGRLSVGTICPRRKSFEGRFKHRDSVGHWGSSEPVNPHIARGMKGWIEWPGGLLKKALKVKLSDSKESQKVHLNNTQR